MKTPTRIRLALAGAIAAALAAGAASAQQTSGAEASAIPPAPQAAPQPGMGMGGMHGGRGMHGGHGTRVAAGHGPRGGERAAMLADANGDGKLGRDELQAAHRARGERALQAFDAADTDKDGVLSVEERRAFRESMRAQSGGQPGAWRHGGPSRAPGAPASPAPARPDAPATPGA